MAALVRDHCTSEIHVDRCGASLYGFVGHWIGLAECRNGDGAGLELVCFGGDWLEC